jgi:chromosome segregation ATPase
MDDSSPGRESVVHASISRNFAENPGVTLVSDRDNAPLDGHHSPSEERRAATHRERVEAIEGLREQIATLEEREQELRKEVPELEKTQRATLAELERTQRATLAELEKTQRATITELQTTQRATLAELEKAVRAKPENVEELEAELERTRTKLEDELEDLRSRLDDQLRRTRTELGDELARTSTEFAAQLAGMRAELAVIPSTLIDARCTLGMKMSDFALDEGEGHEQAVEYLQPLVVELRNTYGHALVAAKRDVREAEEKLKALEAEHHEAVDEALALVERRFEPLIDAEVIGVSIEQANVRLARHQLALVESGVVEPDDTHEGERDPKAVDPHLARELELEAAQDTLDAARAKVLALQEEKRAAVYHYSHPKAEKSKRLGKQLAKRFARHHDSD